MNSSRVYGAGCFRAAVRVLYSLNNFAIPERLEEVCGIVEVDIAMPSCNLVPRYQNQFCIRVLLSKVSQTIRVLPLDIVGRFHLDGNACVAYYSINLFSGVRMPI